MGILRPKQTWEILGSRIYEDGHIIGERLAKDGPMVTFLKIPSMDFTRFSPLFFLKELVRF